jgi:uncharacterized membrane protein
MAETRSDPSSENRGTSRAQIGAGVLAAAGAAAFLFAKRSADLRDDGIDMSDAPDYTWRRGDKADHSKIGRTVTIGKSRADLYKEWRDFTRFPSFMENVEEVITMGDGTSKWTIKAPAGTTVEVVTRITEDKPNEAIAWESDDRSDIRTSGRVEFIDAPPGRGTMVRLVMQYDPPGGIIGQGIAKLLQREPNVQARRDMRRFKQLMETGEVTTNASPSGRKSESPTQSRI